MIRYFFEIRTARGTRRHFDFTQGTKPVEEPCRWRQIRH